MNRAFQTVALCCLLALPAAGAVLPEPSGNVEVNATIRIELPTGGEPLVSVEPGNRQILVEVPRGAVFPLNLSSSSGGLLRGGEVEQVGEDRVRLRLHLASGLLQRIDYEPGSLVLHFHSRFQSMQGSGASEDTYRVGPEDKLLITIHNHPELTSHPEVDRDGTITAPLVGDVQVVGLSVRELAVHLSELLGQSYLVDPQVDVQVEEFRSQWVMVTGEVQLPRRVFLHGGTRLKEIIAEAGGFTDESGETITISRKADEGEEYAVVKIDRAQFEGGLADPMLRHGDIVEVTRSEWCYLQGEVRSPGRVRIERGMTLLRAIALVGGLTDWADRKTVRILYRDEGDSREGVYNLKKIQAGKEEDPVLTGGEVVVVGRRFF